MAGSFGLSQKMNDAEAKCMSCGAPLPAGREGQQKFTGGETKIVLLGDDGEKTEKLLENVKEALKNTGHNAAIEIITGKEEIEKYHVRLLPALVINGSIISQGIMSSAEDIENELNFIL